MLVAENALALRQALLKKRQGAFVFALGLKQSVKIVERLERVGGRAESNATCNITSQTLKWVNFQQRSGMSNAE
jgi:hypothetical protein